MELDTIKLIALPIIVIFAYVCGESYTLYTNSSYRESCEKRRKERKEIIIKYYRKFFKRDNEERNIRKTNNTNVLFE